MTLPVPYPADTRAKGWRFEIDYEKVEQSDTWSLAAEVPMAQHSLLMMWVVAWTQVPCGSFPNDESLIRAKCRLPQKSWPALKPILMRGWWLAEDGRLYHDTLVMRVREMLESRRKNAERVAKSKAKTKQSHEGNALPTGEGDGSYDTGTGTGTTSSPSLRSGADGALATPGEACKAMRAAGLADGGPSNPKLLALLEAGISVDELVDAVKHAAKVKKLSMAYVLAVAEGRRRDAAIEPLPDAETKAADPDSKSAVEAEAEAKGIARWDQIEQWPAYKARVRAASYPGGVN